MKPIEFDRKKQTKSDFEKRFPVYKVIDTYQSQLEELFLIRNPRFRFEKSHERELQSFLKGHLHGKAPDEAGNWFYFPWSKLLVHYLEDKLHQELRTARNKNLVTAGEQKRFYDFRVGIAGLSVGSHAALTLAMMGGARTLRLADPDTISGSNLNRIRGDFTRVGEGKCTEVAHKVYEMNPYADVYEFPQGVTVENIADFVGGSPGDGASGSSTSLATAGDTLALDVVVDELDNLEMKVRLRLAARERGIPVLMATDNGDGVIVDVERYDLKKDLPLFNGALGNFGLEEFKKLTPRDMPRIATKVAGPANVMPRMLQSVLEVGKTLYSWPQLGDAATLAGVSIAYIVKRLALGEPLRSGKIDVNLDAIFDPDYHSPAATRKRDEDRADILKNLGL